MGTLLHCWQNLDWYSHYVEQYEGSLKTRKTRVNFLKTKIMASGPITSWQLDGETIETLRDLILGAPKSLQMMSAAMILKDAYSLEEKL